MPISEERFREIESEAQGDQETELLVHRMRLTPEELCELIAGYRILWQIHGPLAGVYLKRENDAERD